MSEIDNRSLRLASVVPKFNATIVEQALIFNNVKPVVSLTGSLALGTSFVLKLIILWQIIKKWSNKRKRKQHLSNHTLF